LGQFGPRLDPVCRDGLATARTRYARWSGRLAPIRAQTPQMRDVSRRQPFERDWLTEQGLTPATHYAAWRHRCPLIGSQPVPATAVIANVLEWNLQPERRALFPRAACLTETPFAPDDLSMFWAGDDKIILARHDIDDEYWADVCEIAGYGRARRVAVHGALHDTSICKSLLDADTPWTATPDWRGAEPVRLASWGATPELYALAEHFRGGGRPRLDIEVPRSADYWVVPFFGSKTGSRALLADVCATEDTQVCVPDGLVARDRDAALRIAAKAPSLWGDVMLKADHGSGGIGLHALLQGSAFNEAETFLSGLPADQPIVVEHHLGHGLQVVPLAYNGEVNADGRATTVSTGAQVIRDDQYFAGSEMGVDVLSDDLDREMQAFGSAVGSRLATAGYRGPFNVDFIHRPRENSVYAIEINARRSGSSSVAELLAHLVGADWQQSVAAIAVERVSVPRSLARFRALKRHLQETGLYGRKDSFIVMPYLISGLECDHSCGFIVIGDDADSARCLMARVRRALWKVP
jgi:hypothetical protein